MSDTVQPPNPNNIADHRHLYLLVVGVIAGILLGPGVMGRLFPDAYDAVFPSADKAARQLVELDKSLALLRQTGATDTAIAELEAKYLPQRERLKAQLNHASRSGGRMTSLLIVLAVTMILEASIDSRRTGQRGRLTRARYALLAIWIALMLAQPAMLGELSLPFIAMLTLIVLVAAIVPARS